MGEGEKLFEEKRKQLSRTSSSSSIHGTLRASHLHFIGAAPPSVSGPPYLWRSWSTLNYTCKPTLLTSNNRTAKKQSINPLIRRRQLRLLLRPCHYLFFSVFVRNPLSTPNTPPYLYYLTPLQQSLYFIYFHMDAPLESAVTLHKVEQLNYQPQIFRVKDFLSDEECEHLINTAKDRLRPCNEISAGVNRTGWGM